MIESLLVGVIVLLSEIAGVSVFTGVLYLLDKKVKTA